MPKHSSDVDSDSFIVVDSDREEELKPKPPKLFSKKKKYVKISFFKDSIEENRKKFTKFAPNMSNTPIYGLVKSDGFFGGPYYTPSITSGEANLSGYFWLTFTYKQNIATNMIKALSLEPSIKTQQIITALMAKWRKFIKNNTDYVGDQTPAGFMKNEYYKVVKAGQVTRFSSYFSNSEIIALYAGVPLRPDYEEYQVITRMSIAGEIKQYKDINSRMREGTTNCLFNIIKDRMTDVENFDKVSISGEEKVYGINYDGAKALIDRIGDTCKVNLRLHVKDSEGNDIKTINCRKEKHKRPEKKITFYQYNNHASTEKPPSMFSVSRHRIKNVEYLTPKDLNDSFLSYTDLHNLVYRVEKGVIKPLSWWTNDQVYYIADPNIDRKEHPHALDYGDIVMKKMLAVLPYFPPEHKLKHIFQNTDKKEFNEQGKLVNKFSKMIRPIPKGRINDYDGHSMGQVQRHDISKCYTTWYKCEYSRGILPGVPSEHIYQCDNSILQLARENEIEGHVYVRNIKPNFSIASGVPDKYGKEFTKDCLGLHDGIMSIPEALFWDDNGSIEVYAIIPSVPFEDQVLLDLLDEFPKDDKFNRNAFVGKFIAKQKTKTAVFLDGKECEYFHTQHYNAGYKTKVIEVPLGYGAESKYILQWNDRDYDHGRYLHIHNYIIGCSRIRMWQHAKQIVEAGGIIHEFTVDCITFSSFDEIPVPEGWKLEDSAVPNKLISHPTARVGFTEDFSSCPKFRPQFCQQFISLEAPGGYGKTHFINENFPDAEKLAFTHVAANLINGMTISKYLELFKHRKAPLRQTIVIDEASMIPLSIMKELDNALRKGLCDTPYAGRQIILSGDPAQIEPVNDRKGKLIESIYDSGFLDTFDRTLTFQINYRQQGHPEFTTILENFRMSVLNNDVSMINKLRKELMIFCKVIKEDEIDYKEGNRYISYERVYTVRHNARHINALREKRPKIIIKETKNGFYNGQEGYVYRDLITAGDKTIEKWKIEHVYWYAVTSHAAQGQTFTGSDVYVFSDMFTFPRAKSLYVAMSRVTDPKNLIFVICKNEKKNNPVPTRN